MSTKMAANEIRTHARTNQKRTLDRSRGNFCLFDKQVLYKLQILYWRVGATVRSASLSEG